MANIPIIDIENSAYLFDDFGDGSIGMKSRVGYGAITESGGRQNLTMLAAAGFWDGCPLTWTGLGRGRGADVPQNGPLVADLKLGEFNNTVTNECVAGMLVHFRDPDIWTKVYTENDDSVITHYEFGWYPGEGAIVISRWNGSQTGTRQATSGSRPRPSGSNPYILRVIYNNLPTGVGIPFPFNAPTAGTSVYLQPGRLWFIFSQDNGASWVSLLTETPPWSQADTRDRVTHFGPCLRKWNASCLADAHFDHLEAGTLNQRLFKFLPDGPNDLTSANPFSDETHRQNYGQAGADEAVAFSSQRSGQPDFSTGIGTGRVVPGSINDQNARYDTEALHGASGKRDGQPRASMEEAYSLRDGGARRFQEDRTRGGYRVPGRPESADDSWASYLPSEPPTRGDNTSQESAFGERQKPAAGAYDVGGTYPVGGKPYFSTPEVTEGVLIDGGLIEPNDAVKRPIGQQGAGALDEGLYELTIADYMKSKNDSDGKELLGYSDVKQVQLYDATADPWHTHGAGFYGAGRDGVLYYDGVACGPGSFGTLADGRRKTAWATKGDFCDIGTIWGYVIAALPTITADDEMQFALTTGQTGIGVSSRLRWFFTGDFDVQVDYQSVSVGAGPTDGGLNLIATMDPKNAIYVRRKLWGTSLYDKSVINNGGSWTSYASVATTDTSGKLRLTRVGAVVAAYYWTGSAWVQIGSDYTMTYARPMYLDLYVGPAGGTANVTVKVRNFTINSGTTTNLIGWAREAAGTYRGSRSDFPERAAIVSSGNGIDIIDADTDKLWMSFRGGTNNLAGGDANYYIPQIAMKDGVMLASYRTFDSAILDGWSGWIDFTLDFMRLHRGPTYNDAGLVYNVELTGSVLPRDSANGAISWRNSARGFYASHFDNWQYQNGRVNWSELLHDAGFQYRMVANNGGVYMGKWERWKFEGVGNAHLNTPHYGGATKTTAMFWALFGPAKQLYYQDRSKLYVVNFATWSAVLSGTGGTWIEDSEFTLSGTTDGGDIGKLGQDKMVLHSGYLFYARREGVYRMDVSTGVSTLFYGTGGTHDVLGAYERIASIEFANDGTTDLLVISVERLSGSQILVVRLTTNTIYGVGIPEVATRTPKGLAA
jgi:hypothetical protein